MRILEGTSEWWTYKKLLVQMTRAGRRVDLERCKELARIIQSKGHRSEQARALAQDLELHPDYLPRQFVRR